MIRTRIHHQTGGSSEPPFFMGTRMAKKRKAICLLIVRTVPVLPKDIIHMSRIPAVQKERLAALMNEGR